MKYFHVDTQSSHRARWKQLCVGQQIKIGNDPNPIYTNWMNSATRIGQDITASDVEKNYVVMLREMVFENIRLLKHANLPSRKNCIWLCDSEEHARYWISRVPHTGKKRIIEIEQLDGSLHKGYEQHLTNNRENISELENRAMSYWSGSGSGQYELLATGLLRVVRVLHT